jgi:Molecular chaperone GrpE (heat shock protein)
MNTQNDKDKDKNKEKEANTAGGDKVPVEKVSENKTTESSPVPENVAGEDDADNQGDCCDPPEKEKEKEKDKSKRKLENEIKRLGGELEKLSGALDGEKDRYIRLYAEYDNYRRRTAAEKQAVFTDAYTDALKEILPVYDSLERALAVSVSANEGDSAIKLVEGVKLTLNVFSEALAKLGIEQFGAAGDKFDPSMHNAVMHEENGELGEGEITAVFQRGFKKGDRVLRFAMVKVAN